MGLVLAAEHLRLKEKVALKFLTLHVDRGEQAYERFIREARITARLRSEHAARVVDFGQLTDGTPYMVMEYLSGVDLRSVLRQQGALPLAIAVEYIIQACAGLAEAHSLGIVHRDLKPSNLFLTSRRDGSPLVKVVDFGISKNRQPNETDDELTRAGMVLGSPKYMAPEQLASSGDADARADIWSLGAILGEAVLGVPPFAGRSTTAICMALMSKDPPFDWEKASPELQPFLRVLRESCLAWDADKRVQTVEQLAQVLAPFLSDGKGIGSSLGVSLPAGLDRSNSRVSAVVSTHGNSKAPLTSRKYLIVAAACVSLAGVGIMALAMSPSAKSAKSSKFEFAPGPIQSSVSAAISAAAAASVLAAPAAPPVSASASPVPPKPAQPRFVPPMVPNRPGPAAASAAPKPKPFDVLEDRQ
jgi:serine/threonine-protein kinase